MTYNPFTPETPGNLVYWSNPTAGEIRFGYGAIHYAEFTPDEYLRKDGKPKCFIREKREGKFYRQWNLPR